MKKCIIILAIPLTLIGLQTAQKKIDVYKRPTQVEPSRIFDVQHYRIELIFDLDKKTFEGENRISLFPLIDNFKECTLDAEELTVTGVFDKKNAPLPYKQTDKHIIVRFAQSYGYGENVIFTIKYSGHDPKQGLYFDEKTSAHPQMVSVASWPDRAHHWFPCYDYPHDKATHDTIITVDAPLKVLSNGRLLSVTDNTAQGTKTYHWEQDLPHSTYLYTLAIGPFAVIEDRLGSLPVNSWVYEKDYEDGKWIFEKTPYMIDFFNKTYGYEYPWAKHGQFTSPRVGGGMENTTATGLGQSVIHNRRAEQDFSWETTIAHEVAHQWWGQGLSWGSYHDQWLSEGLAQFASVIYLREKYGEGVYSQIMKKFSSWTRKKSEWGAIMLGSRISYNDFEAYQAIVYNKAAVVLNMLKDILGEDVFFHALREFFDRYKYTAPRSKEFFSTFEEISGEDLSVFFDGWFESYRLPDVKVTRLVEKTDQGYLLKLNVVQLKGTFDFPLWIEWKEDGDRVRKNVRVNSAISEFVFERENKPEKIKINPDDWVPGKFH